MVSLAASRGTCPWDTVSLGCFDVVSVATTVRRVALGSPQNALAVCSVTQ